MCTRFERCDFISSKNPTVKHAYVPISLRAGSITYQVRYQVSHTRRMMIRSERAVFRCGPQRYGGYLHAFVSWNGRFESCRQHFQGGPPTRRLDRTLLILLDVCMRMILLLFVVYSEVLYARIWTASIMLLSVHYEGINMMNHHRVVHPVCAVPFWNGGFSCCVFSWTGGCRQWHRYMIPGTYYRVVIVLCPVPVSYELLVLLVLYTYQGI